MGVEVRPRSLSQFISVLIGFEFEAYFRQAIRIFGIAAIPAARILYHTPRLTCKRAKNWLPRSKIRCYFSRKRESKDGVIGKRCEHGIRIGIKRGHLIERPTTMENNICQLELICQVLAFFQG